MIELSNEQLSVRINPVGALLDSIIDNARNLEILWQGCEKSWTGKDVTPFPFIARLKDGYYTVNGEKYSMPLHGICDDILFQCASKTDNEVQLVFESNSVSKQYFPFDFRLTKTFSIVGNKLRVEMRVDNIGKEELRYGIGGHPAINLPYVDKGDIHETAGNYIKFDKMQNLSKYTLNENAHFILGKEKVEKFDNIDLSKSFMSKELCLMLTDGIFENLEVVRTDGVKIGFEFINYPPVLAFWAHPQRGGYICVEPWWGVPDFDEPVREWKEKHLLNKLEINESEIYGYTIIVK